ncbi:ATP-grasp domain-containing protein [Saccharopolyspora sp. 5N708]|uniref:ATP-grasp domain-containing protein n=1 Tax=Saccharopolyspora sp. 5N708 TaxID=3457424 RepID=UPI003FCF1A73
MSSPRRTLAVVYDKGAAGPREICSSLTDLADLVFLTVDTAHARSMSPLLAEFGAVLSVEGDAQRTAQLLGAHCPDGIVTFSETALPLTSEVAHALGLPFHSPSTVRLLTDKHAQRSRLRDLLVDPTRSVLLDDASRWREALDRVGLPAVVKPLRGAASRNTLRIDSAADAYQLLANVLAAERNSGALQPVLVVEEFLAGSDTGASGDYVSVESVVCGGTVEHAAITGKLPLIPPFRETGQYWPSGLPSAQQKAVLDLASAAIRALGIDGGITHTEIKLTDRGPRIIEVNGRLGGWISELSNRTGHPDLIRAAGRIALGEQVHCTLFDSDQTFFQHYNLAPLAGGRLESVVGVRDVRRIPGVTAYRQLVRPGTALQPGITTCQLDAVIGRADERDDMHAMIETALRAIQFQFSSPSGDLMRVNGLALRDEVNRRARHELHLKGSTTLV